MSTDEASADKQANFVAPPLAMKEVALLLVRHYGLKSGTFNLVIEYQIGTGAVGPDEGNLLPGVMIGISKVGLVEARGAVGVATVDASEAYGPT